MPLSSDERLYLFVNRFLWAIFPILMYLNEKDALRGAGLSMQWVDAGELLADWAAGESAYVEQTKAAPDEKSTVHPKIAELAGSLTEHLGDELLAAAFTAYENEPIVPKSRLLYEFYSSLVVVVLNEYRDLIGRLDPQNELYKRYEENVGLFENVIKACELERAFLEKSATVSPERMERFLADIDNFAAQLGVEWREAVLHAMQTI